MSRPAIIVVVLVLWSTAPFLTLLGAALLPDAQLDALGVRFEWPLEVAGLRLDRLFDPNLMDLWLSAVRTMILAASVAAVASITTIFCGYMVTRSGWRLAQPTTEVLSLLAYALPTVFLLFTLGPLLPRSASVPPELKVALMHLVYVWPLAMLLSLSYCRLSPRVLDRATAMDGAGWFQRFLEAFRGGLWRGWVAVFCVSVIISWSDLLFSSVLFGKRSDKLIVDLFFLTYFDEARSSSEYSVASLFALAAFMLPALGLSFLVARMEKR